MIIHMADAHRLEIPLTPPLGGYHSFSLDMPQRPQFVLKWVNVGRLTGDLSVLRHPSLQSECGVYILFAVDGEKPRAQYVGMTYCQSFSGRLTQHLEGLARFGATLGDQRYLYVCCVEPKSYKKLSWKMVSEIEEYFIWAMKPEGNRSQRKYYRGRAMLMENAGDGFGLPRFLYVCPVAVGIAVAQGSSMDTMTGKLIRGWG